MFARSVAVDSGVWPFARLVGGVRGVAECAVGLILSGGRSMTVVIWPQPRQ